MVIIFVISCSKPEDCSINTSILIKSEDNGGLVLNKNDFKVTRKQKYIEIKVLNENKLDLIKRLVNCIIFLNKNGCVSKGINIKSSIKPVGCDYFFVEDDNEHIIVRNKIIRLLSINI